MSSEQENCGIGSLLPMSCRGKAEDFARRLQNRLRSLGNQDGSNGSSDENSWLGAGENPVAVNQPRHTTESDIYFDFGLLESPGSPEEDLPETELTQLMSKNKDNLHITRCKNCNCLKSHQEEEESNSHECPESNNEQRLKSNARTSPNEDTSISDLRIQQTTSDNVETNHRNSQDSDSSDGAYFDPENHFATTQINGMPSLDSISKDSGECSLTQLNQTLENSPVYEGHQNSLGIGSEEGSTLSLRDDEYPSLEYNSCLQELSEESNSNNGRRSKAVGTSEILEDVDVVLDSTPPEELSANFKELDDKVNKCSRIHGKRNLVEESSETCSPCMVHHEVYNEACEMCRSTTTKSTKPDDACRSCNKMERSTSTDDATISPEDCKDCGTKETLSESCQTELSKTEGDSDETSNKDDSLSEYTQTTEGVEEIDENDERIPRVRRCSSLKTGKTPPGTPGRKKIVRFADVLGLDLADVRTFLDEIPKIPTSAYNDLVDVDISTSDSSLNAKYQQHKVDKVLVPLFQQPGGQPLFLDRVKELYVCLENALVDDPVALSIKGTVRVRNLDFNKSVHIRYSLDSWRSFADMQGQYVANSCDGFSDTFSFLVYAHTLSVGQRLEFAVRFQCKGCQYWDNNRGANYCFQCLPATNNTPYMPITGCDDQLGAAFYYNDQNYSHDAESSSSEDS